MKQFSLWSGIIALLVGIFLFIHPFTTTALIAWLIAFIVLFSGIASLIAYFSEESGKRTLWHLVQGIISIVFGAIMLSSSAMSLSGTIMTVTAYWVLISGVFRLIGGIQLRRAGFSSSNQFLGSALIAILVGIFLLFNPLLSAIFIGRLVGLLLIVAGISGILTYFRFR
jgi:uncharacterized membrane protein HdeD (DUF308 family)